MSLKAWIIEKGLQGKLPNWIYRLAGRMAAKEIHLEDNNMETTPWYKRRTSWIAIVGAVLAAVGPVSTALGHPIVVPNWVYEVLGSMGLYTLRDAVEATKQ